MWMSSPLAAVCLGTWPRSFLWLAWRGHRFCDHRFVKDIAWPLFQTLDLDKDHEFDSEDLQQILTAGDDLETMSSKEASAKIFVAFERCA